MENEKRLIDANALRKDTMAMCGVNEAVLENCYPYWQFNKAIVNAPTVDAVDVVRCKDCRWRNTKGCPYKNFKAAERDDDDFCSDGERKDNSGTKCTPVDDDEIDFDYEAED